MIKITVCGNELYYNNKKCGVCGESNSTSMEISFDAEWSEYSKKVVFYNALGENPVVVLLDGGRRVNTSEGEMYVITIPAEPLEYVGEIDFVIDGVAENARKKTVNGTLIVRYSPDTNVDDLPSEVAQTVAEQLQAETIRIGQLADGVNQLAQSVRDDADNGAFNGKDGYTPIKGVDYFDGKDGYTPVKGVDYFDGKDGYTPIKGVDYFDGDKGDKGDTGQSGADGYTPQKGIDYFDGEKGADGKDGYTPQKGIDYFDGSDYILTAADKAEIADSVRNEYFTDVEDALSELHNYAQALIGGDTV